MRKLIKTMKIKMICFSVLFHKISVIYNNGIAFVVLVFLFTIDKRFSTKTTTTTTTTKVIGKDCECNFILVYFEI